MPIDRGIIGRRMPEHSVEVERGRLRFFAQATGQADPLYTDMQTAHAAGHRDLPVPPTFLLCLNAEQPNPPRLLEELGIDQRTILHGEQGFEYHALAYAGDTLTFATEVSDVYEKKGGALEFLVRTTDVHRGDEMIARLTASTVVRNKDASL